MGWLDLLVTVGSTALDLYGQDKASDAEAAAHTQNAARQSKEAEFQEYRTGVRLDELKEYKDQVIGAQRVQMAKSGIVVDQDTAQRVVEDSARKYDKDKATLLMEGKFNVERARLGAASSLESASQVKTTSRINMGRTLLSNAQEFDFFG